jgi:hypothetical protein
MGMLASDADPFHPSDARPRSAQQAIRRALYPDSDRPCPRAGTGRFDPKPSSNHAEELAPGSSPEASHGRLRFNRLTGPRMGENATALSS